VSETYRDDCGISLLNSGPGKPFPVFLDKNLKKIKVVKNDSRDQQIP